MPKYFPFIIGDDGEHFTILVQTECKDVYPKYARIFGENDYSGNGYCWEGHIIQLLEELDPELLEHIDFDPEEAVLFAYIDTRENQMRFLELLCPIFEDLEKLGEHVAKADRSRIDE
ncbi:MAG: hypothetical protein RLZZ262_526 [Bacteroidota bacterium]|jgi:hypothetical protein